ncbi:hypothetical protein LZ31DRAFT_550037 [Colletotrichum somersetense]|nr:hypothetical protein LZ31DRAFT_550037 [Colletotrichum somersetense]
MYASPGQGGTVGLAMGVMPVAFDDTTGDLMDRKLLQPSRPHLQARSGWRKIKSVRGLAGFLASKSFSRARVLGGF